jgi:hypothetical protein
MDYLTVVRRATERAWTAASVDETELQADLLLAGRAWTQVGRDSMAWTRFGLSLLTVHAALYPLPAPIVLTVDAPPTDSPSLRRSVAGLVAAVAQRLERTASDVQVPVGRRLALAAAVIQLREALQELT